MDWVKSLALLIAGALLGVCLSVLITPPVPGIVMVLAFLAFVLLGLYGSGSLDELQHKIRLWRRQARRVLPLKVGILSDMSWNPNDNEISAWSNIGPEEWKREIERQGKLKHTRLRVELITVARNFDSFAAILNPYGGIYPERNLKVSETLNKTTKYVNEGGLFVNVSDLPGYWAYNLPLRRRLDATPPIYQIREMPDGQMAYNLIRLFNRTPLMEQLGLDIRNTDAVQGFQSWKVEFEKEYTNTPESGVEIRVDRAVVVERNVRAILKPKRIQGDQSDLTPLFFTNFGDGRFLFSLVLLGDQRPANSVMKKIVVAVLIDEIRSSVQRASQSR